MNKSVPFQNTENRDLICSDAATCAFKPAAGMGFVYSLLAAQELLGIGGMCQNGPSLRTITALWAILYQTDSFCLGDLP